MALTYQGQPSDKCPIGLQPTLDRREIMSGSESLAIFLDQRGKKNQPFPLCQTRVLPHQFRNFILISTDKSSHPLSKRPMFTANGDYRRKLQVDTMQKQMYQGEHSHRENIYFIVPASILWNGVLILISLIPESLV